MGQKSSWDRNADIDQINLNQDLWFWLINRNGLWLCSINQDQNHSKSKFRWLKTFRSFFLVTNEQPLHRLAEGNCSFNHDSILINSRNESWKQSWLNYVRILDKSLFRTRLIRQWFHPAFTIKSCFMTDKINQQSLDHKLLQRLIMIFFFSVIVIIKSIINSHSH